MDIRYRKNGIGYLPQLPFPCGDKCDHRGAPSLHFHKIAHALFVKAVPGDEDHYRHILIDKGDRAVLHLSRRIAFGMDVGDFL